jgi:hypothetical protein
MKNKSAQHPAQLASQQKSSAIVVKSTVKAGPGIVPVRPTGP